ncbi:hypothetical protein KSD_30100 [Ktedonobacter sp. SOSP1-85]|uniref:TniB family NTP-binding protein n=1 Tax=Ktedonobacter sp. SOSP1-85 TaxID=2778367 RepID=UPI0019165EFC|nr:TniB family NTP-binding protein [Ktedonobacter sp. SOSP1-85]GHO75239.1 hypothetical protein KSD_30100 [Ktedonobacter sp. SOSP1-85]
MSENDSKHDSTKKTFSREEMCKLSKPERLRWVEQMRVFYPLWKEISEEIQRCHQMKAIAAEPQCMLLVGPSGAGKSTLVSSYAQRHPAIVTDKVTLRSVVMATIPSPASISNLETALLSALGDPAATRGTIGAREYRLIRYFKEICNVDLLILDELQHFVDRDNQKILQTASNWLKTFVKETKVSCILVGLQGEAEDVVDANPQLARLFGDPYILAPFEWDETRPENTINKFRIFLSELEKLLPLKEPSYLANYETALRCFAACDGIISYLMALIRRATYLALEKDCEHLDLDFLSKAFTQRLAGERRGIPNPFIGDLPNLEEIRKNKPKQKPGKHNKRGTNQRSKPRNPDEPPEERMKDIF